MKIIAWDVHLNGKLIDTVFAQEEDAEEVKWSLINHDNYDPNIEVKREWNRASGKRG